MTDGLDPVRIEQVPPAMTWALRQTVLRPHQTVEEQALDDDDAPTTATFAAIDGNGAVIGTVRVAEEPPPFDPAGLEPEFGLVRAWRLRGMATRPDRRNAGIGSALLGVAIDHVAIHGGGLLWCNARTTATTLYRRAGLKEFGQVWEEPHIGPHVVMWRMVAADHGGPERAVAPDPE